MKILIISQYFWPEHFIVNDLVLELTQQGHKVEVFTAKPNYPSGKIFDGYSANKFQFEKFKNKINVYRIPIIPRGNGGSIKLILNYLSFLFNGLRFFPIFVKNKKFDVLLAIGLSPIISVIPAILLKKITKSHLAVWVQDLWPDSLAATGHIKNPVILMLVRSVVKFIYNQTDTLLMQSNGFIEHGKNIIKKKDFIYYPNFYRAHNTEYAIENLPKKIIQILKYNKCFIFTGNLGHAQSLDTLLDSVKFIKNLTNIKIMIVGDGSQFNWLYQRVLNENLERWVILTGKFDNKAMQHFFDNATALIVSLSNQKIFSQTIPSKIQAYLASSKPIIGCLNGEGASIINDAKAGLTCYAEDSFGLAECIKTLYFMSQEDREILGKNGKNYFINNFEITNQVYKLVEILKKRLNLNEVDYNHG